MKNKQPATTAAKTAKPSKTVTKKPAATDIDDIFSHQQTLISNKRKSVDASAAPGSELDAELQSFDAHSDDQLDEAGYNTDDELRRIAAEVAAVKAKKQKVATVKHTSFTTASSAAPSDDLGFTRGTTGPARKRTEEGYRVYSEEELKISSNSGDTKDCPFDCNCCF